MEKIKESLNTLSSEIEDAKKRMAQLEGREEEILKRLKTEFNINSPKEGIEALATMSLEMEKEEKLIRTEYQKLKDEYEW